MLRQTEPLISKTDRSNTISTVKMAEPITRRHIVIPTKRQTWAVRCSVFFPIVGLILFLVQKNDTPRAAKSYLLCAAISFGVQVLLSIIVMVIMWTAVWAAVPYIDDSFSYDYDYDYDTATNLFTALISPVRLFFMK